MISPSTAHRMIAAHCKRLPQTTVPIDRALGHVLAETIRSPMDLPRFDNSAMDGFAVRARDTRGATPERPRRLKVVKTLFAGDGATGALAAGGACGIMTGAALPPSADAVIPIEEAKTDGSTLVVDHEVERYRHVRRRGEEIKKGAVVVVASEAVIHPGTIACLATLGRARVRVFRKPRVAVISTGDETVPLGQRLAAGQIYDSNSHMLGAALRQMGIAPVRVRRVRDHYAALSNAVAAALSASDVLIVTGGVSMGERDFLRRVLERQGVREVFWRVAQKPGKPLYFGAKGKRVVFGLPGNPASTFTCFYLYVYRALRRMAGYRNGSLEAERFALGAPVTGAPLKWRFLKARIDASHVRVDPLPGQGSHMIMSLARANGFIVLAPGVEHESGHEMVETYRLPYAEDAP